MITAHAETKDAQVQKIVALNEQIMRLDGEKTQLLEAFESEKRGLEEKLQGKYNRREELEDSVKNMTKEIAELNTERNYLHENISELEKV